MSITRSDDHDDHHQTSSPNRRCSGLDIAAAQGSTHCANLGPANCFAGIRAKIHEKCRQLWQSGRSDGPCSSPAGGATPPEHLRRSGVCGEAIHADCHPQIRQATVVCGHGQPRQHQEEESCCCCGQSQLRQAPRLPREHCQSPESMPLDHTEPHFQSVEAGCRRCLCAVWANCAGMCVCVCVCAHGRCTHHGLPFDQLQDWHLLIIIILMRLCCCSILSFLPSFLPSFLLSCIRCHR